jgi:hypothetical protein
MSATTIPLFNWGLLPQEEHVRARHVQTQLLVLHHIVEFFRSAVELVDHARSSDRSDWMAMAADAAILTLYNFRSTANSILDCVGHCPTLKRHVSTKKLHGVVAEFDRTFPDWLGLRDGVCHYSDKLFAPPAMDKLRPDSGLFIHGFMSEDSMHYVVAGETLRQSVTLHDLELLADLKRAVFAAFRRVAELPPDQTPRR